MPEAVIRPFAPDEAETPARFAHPIRHAHYPGNISREQTDAMLAERYSPSSIRANMHGQCWDAARLGNHMVGFAHGFADDAPATRKLGKLHAHPEHQRQGIGLALLRRAMEHAAGAAATRMVLRVNRHDKTALAAYAKYGFEVYGEHVREIGNGFVMDDYLLEMNLCS